MYEKKEDIFQESGLELMNYNGKHFKFINKWKQIASHTLYTYYTLYRRISYMLSDGL